MNREVIGEPGDDGTDKKTVLQNPVEDCFSLKNVIATSKYSGPPNPFENHPVKLFSENFEQLTSKDNPPSDDEAGNINHLEDAVHWDEENPSDSETTSFTKPLGDTEGLYDDENTKEDVDDEETVLLNGIAKIFFTREANNQNEKTRISSENISSKEAKNHLPEEKPRRKSIKKRALVAIDVFLSVAVVAPVVVTYWKGLWTLMDLYHDIFPAHGYLFLGMGVHASLAILKYHLHAKFEQELKARSIYSRLGFRLVRMFYTYIFSTACVMHWRGAWIIFDDCTKTYEWFLLCATSSFVLILILGRCVRNLVAPPYWVAIDKRGYVFHFPTRFNTNTRDWPLYILDCAFSVGVVGTLVVFVWRGVWVIFDLYLFPDNPEYSAVGSIIIGYTIVVITFALQPLMRYACARLKGLPRLAVADIFLLLSFVGTVNVWRGVWNVLGLWLLPDDPELSCWITHLGCFTFLVLLNCSNSILVRGVYIDAEEAEGKCAVFPCHYLRLFFKIEREKKEARRQNLVVASRDLATITERTEKEENGALVNTANSTTVAENPESLV